VAKPKPLDTATVLKAIESALGVGGSVIPTRHISQDSMPKRNFDMQDVVNVLSKATTAKPAWNTKTETWNYDVPGKDLDGNDLTIRIVPTDDLTGVVLVTGF
jgi:hypothetical protein